MPQYTDQLGRQLSIPKPPQRIVSLVPSLTELLVDLAGTEALVGCTAWCEYPPGLRETKTIIGGTKDVNLEKVRSLKPDLIIANKEENRAEQVAALAEEFPVWISDVRTIDQAFDLFEGLGEILNPQKGKALLAEAQALRASIPQTKTKTVLFFIWKDPYMVAGSDTYINGLLSLAGLENLSPMGPARYPELSLEAVDALNPDIILLGSEPYSFTSGESKILFKTGREVRIVDGSLFTWYGNRLLKSLAYLRFKPFHF